MTAVLHRFDRWAASGPFTAADLGVYRIVYATVMLLTLRSFSWVSAYPDSLFSPPPGPFMLLSGFPPVLVTSAIELVLSIALVSLAIGYRTAAASVLTVLLLLTGSGLSFSLGKIDHTIFTILVPAVLVFARWGDALSVDSAVARRRSRSRPGAAVLASPPQWPLRLLALLIGLGFLTAAVPKILSGWLDPRSQAVQAVLGRQYYLNGRTDLLASFAVHLDAPALWELFDLSAVAIELAIVLTVPWWRAFRAALACAALFHVGVFLLMNINFSSNVLVYAAFISWSTVAGARRAEPAAGSWVSRVGRWIAEGKAPTAAIATTVAVVGGVGAWFLRLLTDVGYVTSIVVLLVGAAGAAWCLVSQGSWILRRVRLHREFRRGAGEEQQAPHPSEVNR